MTRTEAMARERLYRHLWEARGDTLSLALREEAPDAWHTLEADLEVLEPKVKVSLYLDASVAKAYRAMGRGYQARMNRILGTWLQMKIAGLLEREAAIERQIALALGGERRDGGGDSDGDDAPVVHTDA